MKTRARFLTAIIALLTASAASAQTYNQMSWGITQGASPYSFGANIGGTWYPLGSVTSAGAWTIPLQNTTLGAVSVSDFGADPTGVADSTSAISAALSAAAGRITYVPPGTYKLTNAVTVPSGAKLECAGRTNTTFSVNSASFNMSASGVVVLASGGDGSWVSNCGFSFVQPDTAVRASLNAYPPAIYAVGATRFRLTNIRVGAGYTCLNATGNTGGSTIDNLECGALATSNVIAFDGALDFIHINRIECWPFGMLGTTNLYPTVYSDQTTNCMSIGRVDGFAADTISTLLSGIEFTTNASTSNIPYFISNLQLDNNSRLKVSSGRVKVQNLYATTGAAAANPAVLSTGNLSYLTIGNLDTYVDTSTICNVSATSSGTIAILGGLMNHTDLASSSACVSGAGRLEINNLRAVVPPSNRTAAYFDQSGASSAMILNGVSSSSAGVATGNIFSYATDTAASRVTGSTFPNWAHSFGFTTALGFYDVAEPESCTITPSYDTIGDAVLTVTSSACSYYRKGANVYLVYDVTFNTNAFTTASGSFRMTGTIPNALSTDLGQCTAGTISNVTTSAIQTFPYLTNNVLFMRQMQSNAAATIMGTTNVPASKTGVRFAVNCNYSVR